MPSKFTEDENKRIRLVLAQNGGHGPRAAAQLAEAGIEISERRLQYIVHEPEYKRIREELAPLIEKDLVQTYRDAARRSLELQIIATEKAIEQAAAGELKDTPGAARNAAIASGTALDKALILEGRPNQITGTFDIQETITRLTSALGIDIEGTAEEIHDDRALERSNEHSEEAPLIRESACSNARASG